MLSYVCKIAVHSKQQERKRQRRENSQKLMRAWWANRSQAGIINVITRYADLRFDLIASARMPFASVRPKRRK